MTPGAAGLAAVCLVGTLAHSPAASPIQVGLDTAAVTEALRMGRSGQAAREAFHAAYRVTIDDPVLRHLEVVTEFRRVVQLTEERERLRDATWDVGRAGSAAGTFRGHLDLVVFLQFNPQNTYRTLPVYSLVLYERGAARATGTPPIDSRATQAYVGNQPAPPGTPILAGTITATFDASRLDPAADYLVGVFRGDREIRRVVVPLGSLR